MWRNRTRNALLCFLDHNKKNSNRYARPLGGDAAERNNLSMCSEFVFCWWRRSSEPKESQKTTLRVHGRPDYVTVTESQKQAGIDL